MGYPLGPLYKLMLLRGSAGAKWQHEVVADRRRWLAIPAASAKTKVGHLVPLSTLAREILAGVPEIGEYVFRARADAPLQGWSRAKRRLRSADTLNEPWQVEDTRRTAATHMRSLGVDRVVVDKILNHVDGGVIRVYDRWAADPEKASAMERWANKLREIISGKPADNVARFERRAGANV